jgi:hypothetical protein
MERNEFKYVPTIELSFPDRRYSSALGNEGPASIIAARWLALIPFKVFGSIEPNPTIGCHTVMEQFCAVVERFHSCPLSGIIGYETNPTSHSHFCFACSVELDFEWIITYLRHQKIESFDIKPFDHSLDGLPYALKVLNSNGQVDYRNVDLYIKAPQNRKDRKRQARHQQRLAGWKASVQVRTP